MELFFILVPLYIFFILWLGSIILGKAGLDKRWVFCLLIPVANIIAIWALAFTHWPNLKKEVNQDWRN